MPSDSRQRQRVVALKDLLGNYTAILQASPRIAAYSPLYRAGSFYYCLTTETSYVQTLGHDTRKPVATATAPAKFAAAKLASAQKQLRKLS